GAYSLAGIAAALLLILAIPAVVWPQTFFGQARRFFVPWVTAPLAYEVVANPGDAAVARGQSLPLSCFVKATGVVDSLPSKATLVMTDANGKTVRLGMKSDQPNVFFV